MAWHEFGLAFVPLFMAVDALGLLPIFIGLTEGFEPAARRKVIVQSVIAAGLVAVGFIFVGKTIFHLMGVTIQDFMVAGGSLLFILATLDIISGTKYARRMEVVGAVPLGVPLLVGPAVLTTSLMMMNAYGAAATLSAVVANLLLAGLVLSCANYLIRHLGTTGAQVLSKVSSVILATIAVMMIRKGITELFPALVK